MALFSTWADLSYKGTQGRKALDTEEIHATKTSAEELSFAFAKVWHGSL